MYAVPGLAAVGAVSERMGYKVKIDTNGTNPAMLERGWRTACELDVERNLVFMEGDFNRWTPIGRYDVVIANQALHHVLELEHLLDGLKGALRPDGYLLVSDMIGRNGHMRWPEALEIVQAMEEQIRQDIAGGGMRCNQMDNYLQSVRDLQEVVQRFQCPIDGLDSFGQEIRAAGCSK